MTAIIKTRMMKFVFAGLTFLLAANLFSCGQKGPLYLPEQVVTTETAPTSETAATPETENAQTQEKKKTGN